MNTDRLLHTIAVARKMVEIAKEKNLSEQQQHELFLLGYNHDIGYEYKVEGEEHQQTGGKLLRDNGYKYWQEVYYHGLPDAPYESEYLLILNQADMQINKYGNDVGYDKRLHDIEERYGGDSIPYQNSKKLIDQIRNK